MTLENSTRHRSSTLPANSHDRAPSHHKPKLPPLVDIAEMLRGGENLATIAALYERAPESLRGKLNHAGYSTTGDRMDPRTVELTTIPILRPFDDQPWATHGICRQTDPENFYPIKGGTTRPAKAVCYECPVRLQCLEYALANNEKYGVWGGLSEYERSKLKKRGAAS